MYINDSDLENAMSEDNRYIENVMMQIGFL